MSAAIDAKMNVIRCILAENDEGDGMIYDSNKYGGDGERYDLDELERDVRSGELMPEALDTFVGYLDTLGEGVSTHVASVYAARDWTGR